MQTTMVCFELDQPTTGTPTHLRGYIASRFPEYELLHQHEKNGTGLHYVYPKVQYKMLDGIPLITGLDEGASTVKIVAEQIDCLSLAGTIYKIIGKRIIEKAIILSVTNEPASYSFLTPWLALNEKNYETYQMLGGWAKKKDLLEKILIGNLISMSKSLGYTVPAPIEANIHHLKEVKTSLKSTPMLGFLGTFSVNFEIPDYWGIGKSVSRGFGTVVKVNSDQ